LIIIKKDLIDGKLIEFYGGITLSEYLTIIVTFA